MNTRREFLSASAGLAAVPLTLRNAEGQPRLTVPVLDADSPLGVLAASWGRLFDQLVRLYGEFNGMPEGEASDAFERDVIGPTEREVARVERVLMHAMGECVAPVVAAGGKVFVSTCFGPDIPDPPYYVLMFDAAELTCAPPAEDPADDPAPTWFFNADQLSASTDSEADDPRSPLYVEFELHGDQAAAVRAWLDRNTAALDDDGEEGVGVDPPRL